MQVVPGCVHGILRCILREKHEFVLSTIVEIGLFVKPVVSDGAIRILSDQR